MPVHKVTDALPTSTRMDASTQIPVADTSQALATLAKALATLAKALGHPARIHIIETLLQRKSCIGCDLVDEIGLAASTTSEHLRILRDAGLIVGEIAHPRVCYSLNSQAAVPLVAFLQRIAATTQTE
jgi:ArsR family transcriptional regulator, arsenate/arsenite/antimonite-responsive transcriptional repressor